MELIGDPEPPLQPEHVTANPIHKATFENVRIAKLPNEQLVFVDLAHVFATAVS